MLIAHDNPVLEWEYERGNVDSQKNTWQKELEADATQMGYTWKQFKRKTREMEKWVAEEGC